MSQNQKSITGKSIAVILAKILKNAAVLINGIILARLLSLDAFATFQQLALITSSVGLVGALGISKSYFYFLPRLLPAEKKSYIVQSIGFSFVVYLSLSALLMLCLEGLSKGMNNPGLTGFPGILMIFLFNAIFTEYIEPILVALEKTFLYSIIVIVFSAAEFLSLALPLLYHVRLELVCLSYGFAGGMKFLFLGGCFFRLPGTVRLSFSFVKQMLAYSIPLSMTSIMVALGKRLDMFMISALFRTNEFALFSRGALEIPLAAIITFSLSGILVTEFVKLSAEDKFSRIKRLWHETARRTAMVFFPSFLFLLFFAKPFIITLYGEKFAGSAVIFRTYLFLLPIQIMAWNSVPRAFGKTIINMYEGMVFFVSNIILNIVFYFCFGFVGPAIATVAAFYLSNIFTISKILPLLKLRLNEFLPWRRLLKIMAAALVCGLGSSLVCRFTDVPAVQLMLGAIIYAVLFLGISMFSLMTQSDVDLLGSRVPFIKKVIRTN